MKEKLAVEHDLQKTQKRIETLNKNIPENRQKTEDIYKEIKQIEQVILEEKEQYKKHNIVNSKLDAEYNLIEYKLSITKQDLQSMEKNLSNKNSKLTELNEIVNSKLNYNINDSDLSLKNLKSQLDRYDLKKLELEQAKANKAVEELEKQISKYYSEYYDLK